MAASETMIWTDRLGKPYWYWWLTDLASRPLKEEPGNYMFVRETSPGSGFWQPVYIGIADNLRHRLMNHDRLNDALSVGATAAMAHVEPNRWLREQEERALIAWHNPILNQQHRTNAGLGFFGSLYPTRAL